MRLERSGRCIRVVNADLLHPPLQFLHCARYIIRQGEVYGKKMEGVHIFSDEGRGSATRASVRSLGHLGDELVSRIDSILRSILIAEIIQA